MVNIPQVVFSAIAALSVSQWHANETTTTGPASPATVPHTGKAIAVVGAGSAGLAMLRTLLEFPEETRKDWEIVLYEQRRDVGGIWLPQPGLPEPPELPKTPLYPLLRTNTPVPTMTYPGFPFPPMTALYPKHPAIQKYHHDYAQAFNLYDHIAANHTVLSAQWVGTPTEGRWNITLQEDSAGDLGVRVKEFDHLVVATGNNHYPHMVTFDGQDEWLKNDVKREIRHSVWYRAPERYTNRTVLVVGSGASGQDAAKQVALTAKKVYQSRRSDYTPPSDLGIILKPAIAYFTPDSVVFDDGTVAQDIDAVILGTGYEVRVPFLEATTALSVEPGAHDYPSNESLTTNLRYLYPLHEHIVSLCPSHPPGALSFIGLPILVANCPSDRAQSLFAAHVIANSSLLPSREEMLDELRQREDKLRQDGWDPYYIGHRLVNGTTFDYQNRIVSYLKENAVLPDDGKPYVEEWRRNISTVNRIVGLKEAWLEVEELGEQDKWLEGVETEEEWADLMVRLMKWKEDRDGPLLVSENAYGDFASYWDDPFW